MKAQFTHISNLPDENTSYTVILSLQGEILVLTKIQKHYPVGGYLNKHIILHHVVRYVTFNT